MPELTPKNIVSLIVAVLLLAYLAPTGIDYLYNTSSNAPNCTDADPNTSCVQGQEYEVNDSSWDSSAQIIYGILAIVFLAVIIMKITD